MHVSKAKIAIPFALLLTVGLFLAYLKLGASSELDMLSVSVVAPISQPSVGESPIKILVLDAEDNPVTDLKIEVEGRFLSGVAQAVTGSSSPEPEAGIYAVPFDWQHPGLWEIEVKLADAEGQSTKREFVFMAHDTTWICGFVDWERSD